MSPTFVIGVIIFLGVIIVFQQVYFMRQIQKLLDKLMAGNYQGYVAATRPLPQRVAKLDDLPSEDLSVLKDFS